MLRVLVYGLNVFVRGSWRACICVCAGEEEEVGTVGRNIGGGSHDAIALASCSRSPPFPSFAFGDTSVPPSAPRRAWNTLKE